MIRAMQAKNCSGYIQLKFVTSEGPTNPRRRTKNARIKKKCCLQNGLFSTFFDFFLQSYRI